MIDEFGCLELDRRGAEMLFHVLRKHEEKNSIAIASNEAFTKAHTCSGEPVPGGTEISQVPASALITLRNVDGRAQLLWLLYRTA